MASQRVWSEETQVKSSDTDFRQSWKISSFFEAMQEAGSHHAYLLGFGYQDLLKQDMVWVLSRVKVQFFSFPRHEEVISIQTWPKTVQQRLFFLRDFLFLGSDGRRCAAASTAYVLVNPGARRVLPAQVLVDSIPDNRDLNAIEGPLEKILPAPELEVLHCVDARYSSIDLLGHVNNARYIDWISDCFSLEEHQTWNLRELQINYTNEVRPGETVRLARGMYPDRPGWWYVTGTNQQTGLKAFEACLTWSVD